MLMENCQTDCNKHGHMELKNINKEIVSWLEDIIEENNSRIERKEWKSKYNSYVVYLIMNHFVPKALNQSFSKFP